MRVLFVEDDPLLASGVETALKRQGYAVDHTPSGKQALTFAAMQQPDIIILDLGLPDMDGIEVLQQLRRRGISAPVLLLTARDATEEKIRGLDAGADDYLTKPFVSGELFARLRALERRGNRHQLSATIQLGGLILDTAQHRATLNSQEIPLSRREFALLRALMEHPGQVFSRQQLEEKLYSWGDEIASNTIDVHIHNLRKKIGSDQIQTIRGVGYRVEPL